MRANADQFTGAKAAKAGLALSAFCLIGGIAFSSYVHATEVPQGYTRATFNELRPDEVDRRGNKFIPPAAEKLEGKKIFIKGYMRPGSHKSPGDHPVSNGISTFLLARDDAQCCYGDLSTMNYFDLVRVDMQGPLRVNYRTGLFRIGGTLRTFPENAGSTFTQPTYVLEADYAR